MEENFSNEYYDNKLAKNLAFLKIEFKYLIIIVWGGIGYQCYITNHFILFSLVSVFILIMLFFKNVGKRNEAFKKCFNEKDSDIQK